MAFNQDQYVAVVSGRRMDVRARAARSMLRVLSLGYRLAVSIRNGLYNRHLLKSHRAGAPVICIGNLTTGGTGKTPLVVWLCQHVWERRLACAVLTRGYRTTPGELSDEPALLAAQCPDVPVVVNPDRVAGAAEAVRDHSAQVLVMDDGFQHRRLDRDLDVIAIDATVPFGYGRVLPAGLLREPVSGLKRAHAVVLTRCDQVAEETLPRIEEEIRQINRNLVIARSIHAPAAIHTAEGTEIPLAQMKGKQVFAFCGIGNPQAFSRTIERLGATVAGSMAFDDHYRYTDTDLKAIYSRSHEQRAALILTTQKDWTKVHSISRPEERPPLAYLAVEMRFTAGEEALTALIDRVLDGRIPGQDL